MTIFALASATCALTLNHHFDGEVGVLFVIRRRIASAAAIALIDADAAEEAIVPPRAVERVYPGVAEQVILPRAAEKIIIPVAAEALVISVVSEDPVLA